MPVYESGGWWPSAGSEVPGESLKIRWVVLAIVGIFLAFGLPAHVHAQGQRAPAGNVITGVQISGNVRAEVETIRSYMQLREGQAYDPAAADRSLKALFATGL